MKERKYPAFIQLPLVGIIFLMVTLRPMLLEGKDLIYLDPEQPIEKRIEDLLSRMTLEEKISQMGNEAPATERLGIPWNE